MSDQTAGNAPHHVHRVPKTEFFIYFALIFALALPLQTLVWLGSIIRHASLRCTGPVARAWHDAEVITPIIFRG